MRRVVVGIDFGTTNITTLVTERQKDGTVRILGVGSSPSAGMRRGAIVDVEEAAGALRRSVGEASRASGVRIDTAVIGIGGVHVGSYVTRGAVAISRADGEITEDDVARVLQAAEGVTPRNPNREIIHVIPREFMVDGQPGFADPVGMVGMKLEVSALVIDGAKPAIQNIVRSCDLAGVTISEWVLSILAAANVLLTKQQKELGVMLLDLGAGTSDFAIFEESQLVDAGSFPIGGSHITSDIAIGFRTPITAAEEIKTKYAHANLVERSTRRETIALAEFTEGDSTVFAIRDLVEIIVARLTDIFELATKALRKSGHAGLLPGGVVLTGGGADIPGIQDLARRELKLPIDIAKAITLENFPDVIPTRLAVPIGLVTWHGQHLGGARQKSRGFLGVLTERLKQLLRSFVP